MKPFRNIAVIAGLATYVAAFYAAVLPSVCDDAGRPLRRIELLWQLFWLPDQYLLPNWFETPPGFSLLDRLPIVLAAGAILAWAALLGWLVCVVLKLSKRLTPLETWIFSTAMGLSLISTWVLLLGLFSVMDRLWVFMAPVLATLLAVIAVFQKHVGCVRDAPKGSFKNNVDFPVEKPPSPPAPLPKGEGSDERCVADAPYWLWLGVPFALMILLAAMLPPLDFDVREYHLQAPKEFFQQGQITFLPHNVYANMAMGAEMLSLLAMILTGNWWLGALAGKTVIAMFAPLTALALFAAGRRFFSTTAGVVAGLVYLSIPWIISIASGGLIESASACYLFLAVYALLLQRSSNAIVFPILAGYFAGAAVATKYPAVLFVLLPLAAWVVFAWNRKNDGPHPNPLPEGEGTYAHPSPLPKGEGTWRALRSSIARRGMTLSVFLLAAAVGCGLWFGKNWVLTGNPTYPLLYNVFDGRSWNAEKESQWNRVHRPHDFSPETLVHDVGRVVLTSEWLSPLVVPLVCLAFLGCGRLFGVRWPLLAYLAFIVATWWLLTHRIDRFWIPMLPVAALLAGVGACWTAERWWRWCLGAFLMLGLGANFLTASMGQGNAWFVPLEKLRTAPGWTDPWHSFLNAHTAEGRLLAVGDAAVFDLTIPILYNTCFDDCIFEQIVKDKTPEQIRAALLSRGIVYIYANWAEINRYRHTYGFTDFVQPEVFDTLVSQGILTPLPPIEGSYGQGYRVRH